MKYLAAVASLIVGSLLIGHIFASDIHKIVESGDITKLKKSLLEDPNSVNSPDKWGETPLFYAARNKRLDMVELLFKSGARVSIKDKKRFTILNYVRSHIHRCDPKQVETRVAWWKSQGRPKDEVARLLAEHNQSHGPTALQDWTKIEAVLVKALKKEKMSDQSSPLLAAVVKGDKEEVLRLLKKGVHIEVTDEKGRTPLLLAVTHGQLAIAELLLDHGAGMAERDNSGQTAYSYAKQLFELITSKRRERDGDMLQKLIKKGTLNIDAVDKNGETPLMRAVAEGKFELAKHLLRLGARVDVKNAKGQSLQDVVCPRGQPERLKVQILQSLSEAPTTKPRE